ncbi:hypothetical protein [Caminibacter sp.]
MNKVLPEKSKKSFNVHKPPCKECIKTDLHCCNRFPLFNNEELAELIDSGYLDKINKPVRIIRYKNEIYTTIDIDKDEIKEVKLLQEGKANCMFFDKEKGCMLGEEYMPQYCKEIRNCHSIIRCGFCGISEEEFPKLNKEELKIIKEKNRVDFLNYEIAFAKIFETSLSRVLNIPIKKKKNKKRKDLKITKDELIFLFVFHAIFENMDYLKRKGIMKIETKKRLFIEENGTIVIKKELHFIPLNDEPLLKSFLLKLTNLSRITISLYSPEKQDILERKLNGILKGLHNYGKIKDEDLKIYGLLFSIVLMYYYKDKFKIKDKRFKGIFQFKEFNELGDNVLDLLYEDGYDEIEIMREITGFVDSFFKRILKEKL